MYASSLSVTSIRTIIVFDIAVCKPQVVSRDNYLLSLGMFTTKNMPCGFAHVYQSTYNSSRANERVSLSIVLEFMLHLTFVGPCIVIYSYNNTNQMHLFLKFFLFLHNSLHVSEVFPPILRSSIMFIQHQAYVQKLQLPTTRSRPQSFQG
jgi:hypothetical protein